MNPVAITQAIRNIEQTLEILKAELDRSQPNNVLFKLDTHHDIAQQVIREVATMTNVPIEIMFSKIRDENTAWARNLAMNFAWSFTLLSTKHLARAFNRDSRSTIFYAMQRFSNLTKTERQTAFDAARMQQDIADKLNIKVLRKIL